MAEVITMPATLSVLAERIRKACKTVLDSKEAWVETTIELAMAFAEARDRISGNREYYTWIVQNELDIINRMDRHALISMARHIEISRIVLQETQRTSWQMVWKQEIQPRISSMTTESATTETATPAEPLKRRSREPAAAQDVEAAQRLIGSLDTLVRAFDSLDLAAAQRGLTGTQRRQVGSLIKRVRNWFDVWEISK